MNLRPQRPEAPEINLTPLIDVVFLLLIFFMVTTSFRDEGRLRLQLPEADAQAVPSEELELIEVTIDRSGRFTVNARRVNGRDLETLTQALRSALGTEDSRPVLIKADAQAEHQAVMRVLDAARQLGLSQIAFATRQTPTAVSGDAGLHSTAAADLSPSSSAGGEASPGSASSESDLTAAGDVQ
jgi:biopolymer transport protein ExbD